MTFELQTAGELDGFYGNRDPWGYEGHPDDERRRNELLSLLPPKRARTLDIGCGDGFLTYHLPGEKVIGTDLSAQAIAWAEQKRQAQANADRFQFITASLFELGTQELGRFDLIVITGVLYSQYIGRASSVVRSIVDRLLDDGGILASCHIDEWGPPRFPYPMLDMSLYPYRGYTHRLEICRK